MIMVLIAMVAGVALFLFAIVDLVRRPSNQWRDSGHNQIVWALVIVFVGFIGPLLYLVIARPALNAATRTRVVTTPV